MEPMTVTDVDIAFPASVKRLMPPDLAEIRRDRKYDRNWEKIASDWFFSGLDASVLIPKPGVDKTKALRHLKCIIGSFEPKHEDKMASIAYLLAEWFEPIGDSHAP